MQRVAGLLNDGIQAQSSVNVDVDVDAARSHEIEARVNPDAEVKRAVTTESSSGANSAERLASKWRRIRELELREQETPPVTEAPRNCDDRQETRPIRKGASCQNVLKLLQLRKDDQVKRRQSLPRMAVVVPPEQPQETTSPASPTKPSATVVKAAVPPLRLPVASSDRVAVALLRTAAQRRTVSLKPSAFVTELNEQTTLNAMEKELRSSQPAVSAGTQCVIHKTTSAQTDAMEEDIPSQHEEAISGPPPQPQPPPAVAAAETTATTAFVAVASDPLSTAVLPARKVETRDADVQFDTTVQMTSATSSSSTLAAITKRFPVTATAEAPEPLGALAQEERDLSAAPEPIEDAEAVLQRRRQLYREHFAGSAAANRPQRRATGDSFLTIKSEMERMKLKLSELENCAADIEEGFRSTYNRASSDRKEDDHRQFWK
ncbi:hypothetical protein PINS_up007429 [Pythium insidiosum]|nr:hypothetical protein PINS_up007429 [Pythium insidiosum]